MSPTKSFILKGALGGDIVYPIGSVLDITEGIWEIGLMSASFVYTQSFERKFFTVSCNMVTNKIVNASKRIETAPTVLNLVVIGDRPSGYHGIIGFKHMIFFEINNAQQELQFFFDNPETSNKSMGCTVFLHVLLKRVR